MSTMLTTLRALPLPLFADEDTTLLKADCKRKCVRRLGPCLRPPASALTRRARSLAVQVLRCVGERARGFGRQEGLDQVQEDVRSVRQG